MKSNFPIINQIWTTNASFLLINAKTHPPKSFIYLFIFLSWMHFNNYYFPSITSHKISFTHQITENSVNKPLEFQQAKYFRCNSINQQAWAHRSETERERERLTRISQERGCEQSTPVQVRSESFSNDLKYFIKNRTCILSSLKIWKKSK